MAKKLTFTSIMASSPETKTVDVELNGGEYKENTVVRVKTVLNLSEAVSFARDIESTCIDEDGKYSPEFFDFAVRIYTILYYANINMTKDTDKAYKILYATDLYDRVKDCINQDQYLDLVNAAEERISYARDMFVAAASKRFDEALSKVEELIEQTSVANDMLKSGELSDLVGKVTSLYEHSNVEKNPDVNNEECPVQHGEDE